MLRSNQSRHISSKRSTYQAEVDSSNVLHLLKNLSKRKPAANDIVAPMTQTEMFTRRISQLIHGMETHAIQRANGFKRRRNSAITILRSS